MSYFDSRKDVYLHDLNYAEEHLEDIRWMESLHENIECKNWIEKIIGKNKGDMWLHGENMSRDHACLFVGCTYDPLYQQRMKKVATAFQEDAIGFLVKEYGKTRIEYVLSGLCECSGKSDELNEFIREWKKRKKNF